MELMSGVHSFIFIVMSILSLIIFVTVFVQIYKSIKEINVRKENLEYFANSIVSGLANYKYKDISKSKMDEYQISNLNTFKNLLFGIFEDFEKAYNSLDYNTMKQVSTSRLYENYYTGISINIKDGKKKVIDNIKKENMFIYEIYSSQERQTVKTMITISYISYTIDDDGYIVSGSKDERITESFEVFYIKDYKKENFTKCPNCGATVSGTNCDYCRTKIKDTKFKIDAIRKIVQ